MIEETRRMVRAAGLFIGLVGVMPAFAGDKEHSDFEVGQDGSAIHALVVGGDADILSGAEPIELFPITDPFSALNGWYAAAEPGWESVEADEPDEGLFTLLAGHQTALHRNAFDTGLAMFDAGENAILTSDGSSYLFTSDVAGAFHEDLTFAAPPETPLRTELVASLRLTDLAGIHGDGESFSLRFVILPEPGTLALLGLGIAALCRRCNGGQNVNVVCKGQGISVR